MIGVIWGWQRAVCFDSIDSVVGVVFIFASSIIDTV